MKTDTHVVEYEALKRARKSTDQPVNGCMRTI